MANLNYSRSKVQTTYLTSHTFTFSIKKVNIYAVMVK
jgi:hypothetical protein